MQKVLGKFGGKMKKLKDEILNTERIFEGYIQGRIKLNERWIRVKS